MPAQRATLSDRLASLTSGTPRGSIRRIHREAELATDAGEWVLAQLAARGAGEPAKDALRQLERLVTVDEQRLPIERLRHPGIMAAPADYRPPLDNPWATTLSRPVIDRIGTHLDLVWANSAGPKTRMEPRVDRLQPIGAAAQCPATRGSRGVQPRAPVQRSRAGCR
jgi:hypothetical protein